MCDTYDTKDNTADTKDNTADTKVNTADTKDNTADTKDNTADTKVNTADTKDNTADTKDNTDTTNVTIYDIIARSKYPEPEMSNYLTTPVIGKTSCWNPLGDKLCANEKSCPSVIPPGKYYSIRADGKNFSSSVVPMLTKLGIFAPGYSVDFEQVMTLVTHKLCTRFRGVLYAFTQSDEITIIIDKVQRSEQVHEFGGRRDKLLSLASSFITNEFTMDLVYMCLLKEMKKNTTPTPIVGSGNTAFGSSTLGSLGEDAVPKSIIPLLLNFPTITFDARIGVYDSLEEAFELVLWRAYDCSVNGISQTVHNNKFEGHTKQSTQQLNQGEKLDLLNKHGLLPLRDHQAYGTLYVKTHCEKMAINKKTNEPQLVVKKQYVPLVGPVISAVKDKKLVVGEFAYSAI
jgi:tRNA(His) 5'-end guanylyltransferase